MITRLKAVVLSILLGSSLAAAADTLLIEGIDKGSGPTRGMSMERVEARYGAPLAKRDPVGDPPITRWEYPDFVVFFEYQYVIHSVQKRHARS